MEERVKQCTEEKEELQRKIDQLETQNKTLAGVYFLSTTNKHNV